MLFLPLPQALLHAVSRSGLSEWAKAEYSKARSKAGAADDLPSQTATASQNASQPESAPTGGVAAAGPSSQLAAVPELASDVLTTDTLRILGDLVQESYDELAPAGLANFPQLRLVQTGGSFQLAPADAAAADSGPPPLTILLRSPETPRARAAGGAYFFVLFVPVARETRRS